MCDSKKSKFIKEQEASEFLSNLGMNKNTFNILLIGTLLFWWSEQVNKGYKMNEIVNKFLLEGDKFMPEIHLRQP